MISERLMAPGSFTIPMRIDAPYGMWSTVKPIDEAGGGHIVITPEWINPLVAGDAGMLAASRYTGPILEKKFDDGALTIGGAGMGWWLGDDEAGDVYETAVSLSSATLTTSLTALLPDAITAGTIGGTDGTFTGTFHYEIPRDAIHTVMSVLQAEYRINPDGTMDAGRNTSLFNVSNPPVIVTRFRSGSDPNLIGVPVATLKSTLNSRDYASRALVITVAGSGSKSLDLAVNQSPAASGKDIHGNTIVRTLVYETSPGDAATTGMFLRTELNEHRQTQESTISTGYWELSGGTWNVGDGFWVFDDPAFVDTGNSVRFRGDTINPKKMRLIQASWPLVRGMGVAFRDDSGAYTDLTDWVKWEAQDQSIGLGLQGSDLGGRIPGATSLTVRDFVPISGGG